MQNTIDDEYILEALAMSASEFQERVNGTFVETALSQNEILETIEAEMFASQYPGDCAFLRKRNAPVFPDIGLFIF